MSTGGGPSFPGAHPPLRWRRRDRAEDVRGRADRWCSDARDVATRRLDALAERWRSRRARVARPALASVTMGVPRRNPDAPARDRTHRPGARAVPLGETAAADVGGGASSSSPRARAKPPRGAAGVERLRLLPLWEHRPGAEPQQYAVDNGAVRLLLPEEADYLASIRAGEGKTKAKRSVPASSSPSSSSDPSDASDAVPEWVALQRRRADRLATRVKDAFLPSRDAVTADYWDYARFRFVQRAASSCITVFATQQMLQAVGLGATRRLPAAAAVNWVLKDGLGRLGKLSVATNFGREFDSDVKRFRFTSSVVYDCSSFVEMITPFFPRRFLLLATVANVGKSVGITTANVVRAPIQRSFALDENLAEITAKTSAQQVLADNIGLAAAVAATGFTARLPDPRLRLALPLVAFAPLAAVDLYCIYRELKSVQLRTVNKERGEIIAEGFVRDGGRVPCARRVADAERLLIPARLDESSLPLKITGLGEACPTPDALAAALADVRDDADDEDGNRRAPETPAYVLSYLYADPRRRESFVARVARTARSAVRTPSSSSSADGNGNGNGDGNGTRRRRAGMKGRAYLALSSRATSRDVMQAVLQVAHLRALPYRGDLGAEEARAWAISESRRRADSDLDAFMDELAREGWQVAGGKVLLSSAERAPYTVDGDLTAALVGASEKDTDGRDGAGGGGEDA